jgi:hypothetical protein
MRQRKAYIMSEPEISRAIELFELGDGVGTVARKLRDETQNKITEAQVRKRLTERGLYRTYAESKAVKK